MWTIESRKLIRGYKEHIAAGLGGAADYVAHYEDIISPIDGIVEKIYTGNEGGNWLWIKDKKERSWQFAHLSAYKCKLKHFIKKGQVIAISGNTGSITTNPHLHIQVLDKYGKRLDPEIIIKELLTFMDKFLRIQQKFKDKINNPSTIPYTTKKPDGSVQRNIIRKTKEGEIIEKNDVSIEEWIAAFSVWD